MAWLGSKELFASLSTRAQNAILNQGCTTAKDVHREFKFNPKVRNCGKKTLNEIRHIFGIPNRCPRCKGIIR